MRALLPHPQADVDVHALYANDWLDPGGLRVNFVATVDGAATEDGASRGLQTPGDNRIFAALRDLAQRHGLAELSMGTSQDYVAALQEGATIVRLGTTLYDSAS